MGTCIVASVQIIIFSISCSYFEVVVHGTSAQYFFLDSLTINIREKCVMNIINVFDVISKKIETWELKHSCKSKSQFFRFCAPILRVLYMELVHDIFVLSLTLIIDIQTLIENTLSVIKMNKKVNDAILPRKGPVNRAMMM